MTNREKYKTKEEAYKAWKEFCNKQNGYCKGCPASNEEMCDVTWLNMEAGRRNPALSIL